MTTLGRFPEGLRRLQRALNASGRSTTNVLPSSDDSARWTVLTAGAYSSVLPTVAITGATNATPIVITADNHWLRSGQRIYVSGIGGNLAANSTSSLDLLYVDADTIRLVDVTNPGAGLPIVCSTDPFRHPFANGDKVRIEGVKGNTAANNTNTDQFWYVGGATNTTFELWQDVGATIPVEGSGSYDAGSGWVSRADTFKLKRLDNSTRQDITGATNASPIVITCAAHGFSNYDRVIVVGVDGNTAANNTTSNDTWMIQNVTADTFELQGSVGNGTYTASTGTVELAFANSLVDVEGDGYYTSGGHFVVPGQITIPVTVTTVAQAQAIGYDLGLPLRIKLTLPEGGTRTIYGLIVSLPGYEGYPYTRDAVTPVNLAGELTYAGPPASGTITELAIGTFEMVDFVTLSANKHPYYGAEVELPLSQLVQPNDPATSDRVDKWRMTGGGTVLGALGDGYARWMGGDAFIVAYAVVQREPADEGGKGQNGLLASRSVTVIPDWQRPFNADGYHTDGSIKRGSKVTRDNNFTSGNSRTGMRGWTFQLRAGSAASSAVTAQDVVLESKAGSEYMTPIIAATNATPIVIETDGNPGLTDGCKVNIYGVNGNTAANGVRYVNRLTATTYELYSDSGLTTGVAGTGDFGGIQPNKTITAADNTWKITSSTDATPIVVTSTAHGLSDGTRIRIFGHTTNVAANGSFYVDSTGANTFALYSNSGLTVPVAGSGAGAGSGGYFVKGTATGSTVMVITSAAHGFSNGDVVLITGVRGNTNANGQWIVAGVATDTFELTDLFSVNGVGSGTYAGGGTVTRAGGWLGNGLANTEVILESLVLEAPGPNQRFIVMDEQVEPSIGIDIGGQLLDAHDGYRGTRLSRLDNVVTFNALNGINFEVCDIVFGTRIEIACTSQGNRPGSRGSDELTLGGSQFLTVFVAAVAK